jgi:hypothetical protein
VYQAQTHRAQHGGQRIRADNEADQFGNAYLKDTPASLGGPPWLPVPGSASNPFNGIFGRGSQRRRGGAVFVTAPKKFAVDSLGELFPTCSIFISLSQHSLCPDRVDAST